MNSKIANQNPAVDWSAERLAAMRLARSVGIGTVQFRKLMERFGTALEAIAAMPRLLQTGRWPGIVLATADMVLAECGAIDSAGATVVMLGDPDYPPMLAELDSAPPVLVLRGDSAMLARRAVALVGARNASANGCLLARRIAGELAEAGLLVVSGLARGIDTAAHDGALEGIGGTVAVIASGVDIAYPPENAPLMERIATLGCVVSERPMGASPQARHFPRRNRLIAGLTAGVLVVEAAPQSGSLITARLAADAGREVMAVPGSPLDQRHKGTNQLLRDGATLVENAEDVLAAIGPGLVIPMPRRPAKPSPRTPPERAWEPRHEPRPQPPPRELPAGPLDSRLLLVLGPEPVSIDELIRQCHASPAAVQEVILELELEGRIERHPGGRVARKAG